MPKLLGGFIDYRSFDSKRLYGKRFEWGTYYDENELQGISHMLVSDERCWLDMGYGYCYQRLVISSNVTETAKGYDIKGGYVEFIDDGTVTMRWGISSAGPGLNDAIVVGSGKIPSADNREANLHFILEQTDGTYAFDCFSILQCKINTLECDDMKYLAETIKNTSVAHQLVDFKCYGRWHINTKCDLYIWM